MNCWRTRQLLAAFLDGELSPAESQLIEEHVATCPECAELRDRLADLPPLELPRLQPEAEQAVWAQMDAALDEAWERRERGELSGVGRSAFDAIRGWLRAGRLAVPIPVAAAYVVIIVGLTALNLYTFQRVRSLSHALDHEATPAAARPASHSVGAAAAIGAAPFSRSVSGSFDKATDLADDDEEPTPLPPVHVYEVDSNTGSYFYHVVDDGNPPGHY